jgi:hypothetical protein
MTTLKVGIASYKEMRSRADALTSSNNSCLPSITVMMSLDAPDSRDPFG